MLSTAPTWGTALQQRDRATFDAEELAVVLSHYDLGAIESEEQVSSPPSDDLGDLEVFDAVRGPVLHSPDARSRFGVDRILFDSWAGVLDLEVIGVET